MKKQLIRPKKGRVIAGVCRGLAQYFGVDVVWIRLLFIILLLPGGAPGFFPYVILWIVMPNEE